MFQPENQNKKYDFLFSDIDSGRIKIPRFQRDFVWNKEQTSKLIDSIIKGFPVGTFIFWKTTEELRHVKNIGNISLPDAPKGEPVAYVLDGQQRITSLYATRKGLRITKDGEEINYKDISINLDIDLDSDEQVVAIEPIEGVTSISVHEILTGDLTDFLEKYNKEHIKKIDAYKKRLTTYDFSTIVITNYPLDVACEIFTRINTGGTELSLFEIMVAKTYDLENDFDLSEKYQRLIDSKNSEKDLEDADFDTIPAVTVLQCVAACLIGKIKRKDILKLPKNDFVNSWDKVVDSIFYAVDYIRTNLRIPVSELLPYNTLLVPITYFFYKNSGKQPTDLQNKLIIQYFWWASLSYRFSSGVENKLAQDIERIDLILKETPPNYGGEEVNLTLEMLRWKWFSTGDSLCKAILCLYADALPRSFKNDALVKIDNSWLKTSISKNYHHFFPRAYLKSKKYQDWQANSILNITIIDGDLNKREIRAKAPSDYMKAFKKSNKKIDETMKTHLIDDLDNFGVWENDYEKFLDARGKNILSALHSKLNPDLE